MPSLFSRLRPGPGLCPRWLWGRRPRRRLLPPPPPEGLPGPAFIVLSSCFAFVAEFYRSQRPASRAVHPSDEAPLGPHNRTYAVRVATGHAVERTPTLSNELLCTT